MLSFIFGDFNFVEHSHDRTCKTTGQHTGSRDSVDARLFGELILQKGRFFELEQEHHTFEGGRALSKLDRVYANWHVCDQLDHSVECVAGPWPQRISDHRPVFFARRLSQKNYTCAGIQKPLPAWTVEHESWGAMVKEAHLDLMLQHCSKTSHSDLALLKQAMRHASRTIAQTRPQRACTHEDKMASSITFFRSAMRGDVVGQLKHAESYPHLKTLVDPTDAFLCEKASLQRIRDHIVELAGLDITVRIQAMKDEKVDAGEYAIKKEHLLVRLRRLMPGTTSGLNALEDPSSGAVVTEPREMARLLTEHWGKVLTSQPIDKHLLARW